MPTTCEETFEALSEFIGAQRAFLARTQADIDRLKKLKKQALEDPSEFVENLSHELNSESFKLSAQEDHHNTTSLLRKIDWSLYESSDPEPMHDLALRMQATNAPKETQSSPLSPLQMLVKEARPSLLARLPPPPSPLSSDEEEPDPEELKRQRARDQIRELKKRRIGCGLTVSIPGTLDPMDVDVDIETGQKKRRSTHGVYIRRDVEDESAEVDISLEETEKMHVDTPPPLPLTPVEKPVRSRRPSAKLKSQQDASPLPRTSSKPKALIRQAKPSPQLEGESEQEEDEPPTIIASAKGKGKNSEKPNGKKKRDAVEKPRPDTYKQAWSVSEQHLLEKLLEEILDGEKNRWQKISRAMGGRRTPRQVASRVQKYFEKLKRFGIGINGGPTPKDTGTEGNA